MRRIVNYFLLALVFFFTIEPVLADDVICEYPKFDMTLTYTDSTDVPQIDYKDWQTQDWYLNFFLVKTGQKKYTTDDININQSLYRPYIEELCEEEGGENCNGVCPDKLYICEHTRWSLNIASLVGQLADLASLLSYFPELFGADFSDFREDLEDYQWALVTLGQAQLYLMDRQDYKENFRDKEGAKFSSSYIDSFLDSYEDCYNFLGGIPVLSEIGGYVCGSLATVTDQIVQNFTGEEYSVVYFETYDCTGARYEGENVAIDVNCRFYEDNIVGYPSLISEYQNCSDESCRQQKMTELNKLETTIAAGCEGIMSTYLYTGDQVECLDHCLNLKREFNDFKKGTDLYRDYSAVGSNECNLSDRLVAWIIKILSWVRYVVPAILVVLSVLDFIKAIASDNEEEIKKVAGRFTKRLIAAVIILILPALLEFLLGIFNKDVHNYCLK